MDGLCREHHEMADRKHRRFMETDQVLHTGVIDGEDIRQGPLRDELQRVREWWGDICAAERTRREHPILREETQFGMDWCIAIAQEIVDAERDLRAGKPGDTEIRKYRRDQTWERFENLAKGLKSNGVARPRKGS